MNYISPKFASIPSKTKKTPTNFLHTNPTWREKEDAYLLPRPLREVGSAHVHFTWVSIHPLAHEKDLKVSSYSSLKPINL